VFGLRLRRLCRFALGGLIGLVCGLGGRFLSLLRFRGRLDLCGSSRFGVHRWLVTLPTDEGDFRSDVDGFVLVDEDLGENARDGGRDLGVHLVGGDFEEWFVHLDGVSHVLQLLGDGSFGDALTEVGHAHRGGRPGGFPAWGRGGRRLGFGLGRGFGGGFGLGGGFGGGFGLGGGVV